MVSGLIVTCPDLHGLDVFGADRYETAPKWGPGMVSGPYRAGALYLTGRPGGTVAAMGCLVGWTDLAGHGRTWSSVTVVPWAAGPLSVTGLGQACPWHVSVSRASVGFYSRQKKDDKLVQHGSQPVTDLPSEGGVAPVAVAARGKRVAVAVGTQVLVDDRDAYASADRGQWPCWETYVNGADQGQDPRPWIGAPWCVTSQDGGAEPAEMRRLLGAVPGPASTAFSLVLDALA